MVVLDSTIVNVALRPIQGFEVSAAIMVLALVVAAIMIRVTRQDLTGSPP
jgi:hypothetical protein